MLLRQELGDVLREIRRQRGDTLRQISGRASVALGYLSEIERGQKEASSEILAALAEALHVPVSVIMRKVSDRMSALEDLANENITVTTNPIRPEMRGRAPKVPDTIPADMLDQVKVLNHTR